MDLFKQFIIKYQPASFEVTYKNILVPSNCFTISLIKCKI